MSDQQLLTLLCATAVGAAFGVNHADTHPRTRERRQRVAGTVRNAAHGTTVRETKRPFRRSLCFVPV